MRGTFDFFRIFFLCVVGAVGGAMAMGAVLAFALIAFLIGGFRP